MGHFSKYQKSWDNRMRLKGCCDQNVRNLLFLQPQQFHSEFFLVAESSVIIIQDVLPSMSIPSKEDSPMNLTTR